MSVRVQYLFFMFTSDLAVNAHQWALLQNHIAAIPDERMAERPDLNHAAWQLGHLTVAYDMGTTAFGQQMQYRRWLPQFTRGSKPEGDRSAYPSKDELVKALTERHETIRKLAAGPVDPAAMAGVNPFEPLRERLPTTRDLLSYLLNGHVGMHLGQLSVWRRVVGLA